MNQVYETEAFSELYDSCETAEQEWIDKMKDQLTSSLLVGKPLQVSWFREKKMEASVCIT